MGTSQSSTGPGAGVPLVPPWADDLSDFADAAASSDHDQPEPTRPDLAPLRRFRSARAALGRFAQNGRRRDLRRSFGHYVADGYGGRGTAARRMASTARTAGRLDEVLRQSGPSVTESWPYDGVLASATDATTLLEAVVDAIRPVDGTLDAETSRRSLWDALSDLLIAYPQADLADLNADQRWFAIERFVALDVYNMFCRDMLKTLLAKAPDHTTALARLGQVRSYVIEVVAASFRKVRDGGSGPSTASAARVVQQAITDTFAVFESYVL